MLNTIENFSSKLNKIHSEIEDFGSDSLKVCGGKFEGGIYLQQVPDEVARLINYLIDHTEGSLDNVLEIGSASGGMAFLLHHYLNTKQTVIIDDNKHKRHKERKRILKDVPYIEFIGDSHSEEAFKFVRNLGLYFNIIIIDGDHSYEGVKKDTEMYFRFSDYQQFVVYHDIVACPGVKKYFRELIDPWKRGHEFDMVLEKAFFSSTDKQLGLALFRSFNLRL